MVLLELGVLLEISGDMEVVRSEGGANAFVGRIDPEPGYQGVVKGPSGEARPQLSSSVPNSCSFRESGTVSEQ